MASVIVKFDKIRHVLSLSSLLQPDLDPVGSAQYTVAKYASTPTIMAVQAIEAVRIKLSWVNANLHHEASRDGWSTPHKIAATCAI